MFVIENNSVMNWQLFAIHLMFISCVILQKLSLLMHAALHQQSMFILSAVWLYECLSFAPHYTYSLVQHMHNSTHTHTHMHTHTHTEKHINHAHVHIHTYKSQQWLLLLCNSHKCRLLISIFAAHTHTHTHKDIQYPTPPIPPPQESFPQTTAG